MGHIDWVRGICLGFPGATEQVQWGNDLVFKVGGKMFAVAALEPGGHWLSFKCTAENFADLCERPGLKPAPYLARAHWVAVETQIALSHGDTERLLGEAYDLILQKLSKAKRAQLGPRRCSGSPHAGGRV